MYLIRIFERRSRKLVSICGFCFSQLARKLASSVTDRGVDFCSDEISAKSGHDGSKVGLSPALKLAPSVQYDFDEDGPISALLISFLFASISLSLHTECNDPDHNTIAHLLIERVRFNYKRRGHAVSPEDIALNVIGQGDFDGDDSKPPEEDSDSFSVSSWVRRSGKEINISIQRLSLVHFYDTVQPEPAPTNYPNSIARKAILQHFPYLIRPATNLHDVVEAVEDNVLQGTDILESTTNFHDGSINFDVKTSSRTLPPLLELRYNVDEEENRSDSQISSSPYDASSSNSINTVTGCDILVSRFNAYFLVEPIMCILGFLKPISRSRVQKPCAVGPDSGGHELQRPSHAEADHALGIGSSIAPLVHRLRLKCVLDDPRLIFPEAVNAGATILPTDGRPHLFARALVLSGWF